MLPVGRKGGNKERILGMEECLYPLLRRLVKLLGEPMYVVPCALNLGSWMDDCKNDYQDLA